jgi:NAD(P)-dependent dehydrogenase (short-subunit alcohol dehydrogenase family)
MIGQVPMRRFGTLGEVASSVVFLLSDDASYLTGVNLEIAGGAR